MALGGRKPHNYNRTYLRVLTQQGQSAPVTGRKKLAARVDLCRVHTERFRDMTPKQISTAMRRLGPIPKPERIAAYMPSSKSKHHTARALLHNFLFNLYGYYSAPVREDPQANAIYRRNYGEDPAPNRKIKESYKREAARAERAIHAKQIQAGCQISSKDLVSRDAREAGKIGVANRIRRQGYRPHHKRGR